jgi:hypothetical protein
MSIWTIVLIILVIALLGGFAGIGGSPFYGTGYYGGGGLGLVIIILFGVALDGQTLDLSEKAVSRFEKPSVARRSGCEARFAETSLAIGETVDDKPHLAPLTIGAVCPHIRVMTPFKADDEAKARKATLQARKIAQADEGRAAMADYERQQAATLDRTAKLKALRLAQEAKPEVVVTPPPKRARPKSRLLK